MNNDSSPEKPASRRQFLQGAGAVGGALILGRAASAQTALNQNAPTENVLKLDEHPDLQKVGGFEIVLVGAEKVIVAHTEAGFVACSAICPHRNCEVEYRASDKQFVCPCHNSRFDEKGKVLRGPAKTDLKPFDAATALLIKPATAPKSA
ncbi:MAG: Rieske (2Fe-2S) protein [Armatimonadetes bacterium]|nr:Rieske (2Fe-2S) protein [Armatimonadota bacterium]